MAYSMHGFNLPGSIPGHCASKRAFTLIETLAVVAILGVVVALCIPALSGMMKSSALLRGGQMVEGWMGQARQMAVSKNTMVALVILTDAGTDQDFRAMKLMQYVPDDGWQAASIWEFLPEGVILDSTAAASTLLAEKKAVFPLLPANQSVPVIEFKGIELTDSQVAICIFLPSGGRRTPESPAQLRLVQGYRDGTRLVYTQRDDDGLPADYIDLAVVGVTGSVKRSRPS